jgi:hypothetical protein
MTLAATHKLTLNGNLINTGKLTLMAYSNGTLPASQTTRNNGPLHNKIGAELGAPLPHLPLTAAKMQQHCPPALTRQVEIKLATHNSLAEAAQQHLQPVTETTQTTAISSNAPFIHPLCYLFGLLSVLRSALKAEMMFSQAFSLYRMRIRAGFHLSHLFHLGARTVVARFWPTLGSFSHR